MNKLLFVLILSFGINSQCYAGDYFEFNVEPDITAVEEVVEQEQVLPILEELPEEIEDTTLVSETEDQTEQERDILAVLFGGTFAGLLGFIIKIVRVWYQSKTGQIIVTQIKNDIDEIEQDIIDKIVKITDIETGEMARKKFDNIQKELLKIANEKLEEYIGDEKDV